MRFSRKPIASRLLLAFVLLILTWSVTIAHTSAAGVTTGTTTTGLNLRPEPTTVKPPLAVIPGGTTIEIYGRNASATWLSSSYQGKQGWVYAAFVVLANGSSPSDLPIVEPQLPTPGTIQPPVSAFSSYIHNITPRARQIYLAGLAQGNRANVFSKLGDSITASWAFLNKIGDGNYSLNDYAYLGPVISYYSTASARTGNSFSNDSVAAVEGWTSFDLIDPNRAIGFCSGMTPLTCEYNLVRPSVAIIMIGTNDTDRGIDRGAFATNLQQIVSISVQYGVIPILSTIPYHHSGNAAAYNDVIIATATVNEVPWMDFYGATVNLPNHGNDPDGVHPAVPPTHDPTNFTPDTLQYGFTVRNLLALHMLDAVWRQVLTP